MRKFSTNVLQPRLSQPVDYKRQLPRTAARRFLTCDGFAETRAGGSFIPDPARGNVAVTGEKPETLIVRDIMSADVISVSPNTSVREIAEILSRNRISSVPVVDGADRMLGLVRDGDLIRRVEIGTEPRRSWWQVIFHDAMAASHDYDVMTSLAFLPCDRRARRSTSVATQPYIWTISFSTVALITARVIGVGIETADMLVHEVLTRNMRDRRAVARYGGLTGSPDESGRRRREKGLARSGNARVRRGMIQLAWRFLLHQKNSALAQWYRARTENARGTRKPMIVALARKLLIALWRLVRQGVVPDGVVLRLAQ